MMVQISTKRNQDLRQIADMLLLHGTLTECPGLVYGKMGIAVFFFHYARYTENTLFADYALDLIGETQNQLHANSRADYEKGIAGTRLFHLSFELGVPFPYPCQCGMGGNTVIGNQCVTNISNLNFSHF